MAKVQVDDGAGCSVTMCDIGVFNIVSFFKTPEETKNVTIAIRDFKCREDDVILCSPVKSGTHWTWEIACMLHNGNAETVPVWKADMMLEAKRPEKFEAFPSPRVLNSHLRFSMLPKEAVDKKCKFIFVCRNPKDLVVSLWHHAVGIPDYDYDGKFEHFVPLFLDGKLDYGCWFTYMLEWEKVIEENKDLNILVLYYEDMKEDLLREVKKIAAFLKIQDDSLCKKIADKCAFTRMAVEKRFTETAEGREFKGNFSMYRKGEVGDWKNHFTVAMSEYFDSVYNEQMKASKFKFRYSL